MHVFKRIGIDLGSYHIRVVDQDQGILWDQPACLALSTQNKRVMAVGHEAMLLQGRAGEKTRIVWPIQYGVVAEPDELLALLKVILRPVWKSRLMLQPTMVVTVPVCSTPAQREVVVQVLTTLGAREVIVVAQPLAAMIGAGVPVADPTGSCFLQVGHGVMEAGVIALGSIGVSHSSTRAGQYLDWKLRLLLQLQQHLVLSFEELQLLKSNVLSLTTNERIIELTAKDAGSDDPVRVTLTSDVFTKDIEQFGSMVVAVVRQVLQAAAPELVSDSMSKGILLSGGLSQLDGLDGWLSQQLQLPVLGVEQPAETVALGLLTIMQHLDEYRKSLGYQNQ